MNLRQMEEYLKKIAANPEAFKKKTKAGTVKFDWTKIIEFDKYLSVSSAREIAAIAQALESKGGLKEYLNQQTTKN